MKTTLLLLGAVLLASGPAFGQGAAIIIKERARELSNQNNVRQGVAPPTQASPSAAPATSASVTRLQADLAAMKEGEPVTAEQRQKLAHDLMTAAETDGKPSQAAVNRLAADLADANAEKPLSARSRARLVQELNAVLNPRRFPTARWDGIFGDVQAIFQENGLARKNAAAISEDVKTVSGEVRGMAAR